MSTEPKYLHPSVTSKIIDTSSVVLTAAGLNNMFVALEAEKGAPNEAMYISSASQFIFTLGEPNFAKWGQAGMNAMNWLRAGGGLWVIRVVPDDETFASLSLGIGYNDSETYTNDEEEYKNLELTADQIKLWNIEKAAEDDNKKFVRGTATGKTVPVEKFYAGKVKDGVITVESKLGTMTADAIKLYNISNGNTEDNALEPLAVKKEVEVEYGMSFGGDVKPEAAIAHQRKEAQDYTSYSISKYAQMHIYDYVDDQHSAPATDGLIRYSAGNHASSVDGLFSLTGTTADALWTALATANTNVVAFTYSVQDETSSSPSYTPETITLKNNNFVTVFTETDGSSAINPSENYLNFPKYMKVVYPIESDKPCRSYTTIINNTFYGTDPTVALSAEALNTALSADNPNTALAAAVGPALSDGDIVALNQLNTAYYGPCYENLFKDANAEFIAFKNGVTIGSTTYQIQANLNLTITSSEAKWQYCYDVTFADGTPAKSADVNGQSAMTKNYIYWYNLGAKSYKRVKVITETDTPSTGIYERVKTYNVNYASNGEPVYGFYMTEDEVEIFKTSQPEARADVLSIGGAMGEDTGIDSMANNVETIFNQTASINTKATSDNTTIRAFNYLAPLFSYEISGADAQEGYKKVNAILKATDTFKSVQVRNLLSTYTAVLINETTMKFNAECNENIFKDIGLYDANGALVSDAEFEIDDIEVPEVFANILVANKLDNAQIPLSNTFDAAWPVSIWNVVPAVNGSANTSTEFALTIKLSFYSSANGATLLALDDKTGLISFRSSSISEYLSKQNFTVVYEDSPFVPNSDYIENTYKAIGFCVTPFTDRSKDNTSHEGLTPADIKRGYVVDENRVTIQSVDPADMRLSTTRFVEFARFLPKGSGPWYNKLAVSLTYENAYNNTYPDWSMFTLSVIEKSTSSEIVRESFDVALDPDAISGTKESLFIEDVVNRYSSYLTCVANYDNLQNFIDTKLKVTDGDGNPIKDEDGNEIIPSTDKVVKYIFNQITLDELNVATFGEDYQNSEYADYVYKDLMSAIGYDSQLCHLDTTLNDSTGEVIYNDPFVSEFYYQTVDTNAVFYLAGGTRGHGWGYETIDPDTDETVTTATLTQALTRAYNGTTDPLVTNTQTCVFDIMMDANYDITVKDAMSDLAALTRGDCITILDMNHDCANASQAVAKRKDQMQYNTYFTSIFSQTLGINDEWTGKPVRVTPTFFLATKIPQNDAAYTEIYNFVGPRRGTIAGFRDVSWLPTEPEKTELYKNQINYIEQDTQATMFATENTSQKITSPLSMIHAVRSLLKLKRQMEQTARNYRMEFSTDDIRGHLQEALNNIANNKVLAGGYDYISPVVSASAYDRQQKICRVKVDLAFTDIMERFVFEFVVNRAS